jgi:hypothetical protein
MFIGKRLYKYEPDVYEIGEESVTDTVNDEKDIGFKKIDDEGFIKTDSDIDYLPSGSESDYDSESVTESSDNSEDEDNEYNYDEGYDEYDDYED